MIFGPKPYTPPACARDDCTNAVAWQVQIRQHDVTSIGAYYCDADLPDRLRRLVDHEGDQRMTNTTTPVLVYKADTVATAATTPGTECRDHNCGLTNPNLVHVDH